MKSRICLDIEKALGYEIRTPKDFDALGRRIFGRLGVMISPTTLKRLWGYIDENVQARVTTLDILARFLGYKGYEDYNLRRDSDDFVDSSPVMSRRIDVEKELAWGDRLALSWLPDRECVVRYDGNQNFTVISSANTRVLPGNTFRCHIIIEGEPLYLDDLRQGAAAPMTYVCGKKSGIRFEKIN